MRPAFGDFRCRRLVFFDFPRKTSESPARSSSFLRRIYPKARLKRRLDLRLDERPRSPGRARFDTRAHRLREDSRRGRHLHGRGRAHDEGPCAAQVVFKISVDGKRTIVEYSITDGGFGELTKGRIKYKIWAVAWCVVGFGVANFGLTTIIKGSKIGRAHV